MRLKGKRIVLTGTKETIGNIASGLTSRQAEILSFPTIEIETLNTASNQKIIQHLASYHWLAFTSKQGVRSFFELWGKNDLPPQLKTAVIGEKTREVLQEYKLEPDFVSHGKDKNDMLAEWREFIQPEEKILLAVSALADASLEKSLAEVAIVDRIDVYTSHPPSFINQKVHVQLLAERYDMVVFTSPSSVKHYHELVGKLPAGNQVLSIGPTTSKALQDMGCKAFLEADQPSAESIVETLEKFYTTQKSNHGIS